MTPMPIHYHKVHVGFVWLDGQVQQAVQSLPWSLELPPNIRGLGYGVDVLIGLLREDETILKRATVYQMLNATRGFKVRLNKIVLHQDIVPMLQEFQLRAGPKNQRKEILFHEIRSRLMQIRRVIHIDGNKMNCQTNNLRELSYEPLEEQPHLYHEDQ